jgi:hypothetical protein
MPTWTCQWKDAAEQVVAVARVDKLATQRYSVVVKLTGREDAETADMASTVEAAQERGAMVVKRLSPGAHPGPWTEE